MTHEHNMHVHVNKTLFMTHEHNMHMHVKCNLYNEPHREKTGFLPRRKQRRRSASR